MISASPPSLETLNVHVIENDFHRFRCARILSNVLRSRPASMEYRLCDVIPLHRNSWRRCTMRTRQKFTPTNLHTLRVLTVCTSVTVCHDVDKLSETLFQAMNSGLAYEIIKDSSHSLHKFYSVARSGCRYISESVRTNWFQDIFLPTSIRLMNARSGVEMVMGLVR